LPRIPPVSVDSLTPAQREVYERIIAGPRGTVVGPLRVLLHSPALADRCQALGEYLRFGTVIPALLRELTIIVVGRRWNCQLEWLIHAPLAYEAGLSQEVIEAIRTAQAPEFADDDQAAVYELTRELSAFGRISDEVYDEVHALLGTEGAVELIALIGYYSMVAMTLNSHHVPLPQPEQTVVPLSICAAQQGLVAPTALVPAKRVAATS
jgi:4-carboxymuconolactone decarboxylase